MIALKKSVQDVLITATVCCVTVLSVSLLFTDYVSRVYHSVCTALRIDLLDRCNRSCYYDYRQGLEFQAVGSAMAAECLFVRN